MLEWLKDPSEAAAVARAYRTESLRILVIAKKLLEPLHAIEGVGSFEIIDGYGPL
jgi:hypothetical protein